MQVNIILQSYVIFMHLAKHQFIEVNSIFDNYAKEFHWGLDRINFDSCIEKPRLPIPPFGLKYTIEDQFCLPIKIFGSKQPNTLIIAKNIIKNQYEKKGKYSVLHNHCLHACSRAWAEIQDLDDLHQEFIGIEKLFEEKQKNIQEYENMKSIFSQKLLKLQNEGKLT